MSTCEYLSSFISNYGLSSHLAAAETKFYASSKLKLKVITIALWLLKWVDGKDGGKNLQNLR